MLKLGGIINIIIAIAHIIGLIWADQMFEITGIGKEMTELSNLHFTLPYLLTMGVAFFFLLFGLYGLSAHGSIKELPFLKIGIFLIAGIYLFRGVGELIFDAVNSTNSSAETTYSIIAILIGIIYLAGGIKKWYKPA